MPIAEKVLSYDRNIVGQETGWWCGPASTQVALNIRGVNVPESSLAAQIEEIENPGRGDDRDGTDHIGEIRQVLNRYLPDAKYAVVELPNDPPTPAQKATFWEHVTRSIDAGHAIVMNWVVPFSNRPIGQLGSASPNYRSAKTWHYVTLGGYKIANEVRYVWIIDSGFQPSGYWITFDQCATLIPPKAYCWPSAVSAGTPTAPVPVEVPPKSAQSPLSSRDRYALAVIAEGRRRGITPRGITIALATCLVESNLTMYANGKVPESLSLPYEKVGSDGRSVGLFQQQVVMENGRWWWGDARTCMDPTLSAGLFYDRLAKLDYNNPGRSPGSYAQDVQGSAFPARYDERYADAQDLYNRLQSVAPAPPANSLEALMADTTKYASRSPYRDNNDKFMTPLDAIFNLDAMAHAGLIVEPAALRGEGWAIEKVARLADGQGPGSKLWWDDTKPDLWAIAKARFIINYLIATNKPAIDAVIAAKGASA